MRRMPVGALVLALGSVLAPAAQAADDTPGCVTRGEWSQVYRGDRQGRVVEIFGAKGGVVSTRTVRDHTVVYRKYARCSSGFYWIRFRDNRIDRKLTDTTYANCTEVREAGVDPLFRGQPGYGGHLDRDGDGVACET